MSDIQLYGGTSLSRHARRVDSMLARIGSNCAIRLAHVESEAELIASKADALGVVGGRAMQDVALLSQMEQQLALTVPAASGRLAQIADVTAIAMSGVVADAACVLRRV